MISLLMLKQYIDELMQERHNSIANALELRLSSINPSICVYIYTGCDLSLGFPDVDMGNTMAELQVYVTTEFTCDGAITAWSLYARRTGTVFLSVWRTIGPSKFQMVAKNELNVTETGYVVSYWNSIVTKLVEVCYRIMFFCSYGDVNTYNPHLR